MANTYPKAPLRVSVPSNSFLSLIERAWPEGASQTFPVGAPLKLASGLAVVWVSPTDAPIAAFSLTAGQNLASGAVTKVVLAEPHVELEANLLGSAAADYTLLATDLGTAYDLKSAANLLGTGVAGWYFAATTTDVAVRINNFSSDIIIPNQLASSPAAGDTNARVKARVEKTKSLWY